VCKKLIKNSQPFVKKMKNVRSPQGGFFGLTLYIVSFCARQHICYSTYMLSPVRLSVRHTGGSVKKRLKLGSRNFHHTVAHDSSFLEQVSSRNSGGSRRAWALNKGGVGKIGDFRTLSRHISETVQDMTKVAIEL